MDESYVYFKKSDLLSGKMQGATTAPEPLRIKPSGENPSSGKETRKELVRLQPERNRAQSMEIPSPYPLLSKMGYNESEINEVLRNELLRERSHGRHEGSLADWKHYYTTTGPTQFSTSNQIDIPLARIAGGTSVSNRTSQTIKLRKCRCKIFIRREAKATGTVVDYPPTFQFVFWRDKIPTTPGSVPTIWGVGTNPPTSGTTIFESLGNSAADARNIVIRNPITEDAYHIYHIKDHIMQMHDGYQFSVNTGSPPVTTTGVGNAAPNMWRYEHTIEFNDVQQNYPSYASSQSDINDPYLTFRITSYNAAQSFNDYYTIVTDTEFYDEQL